MAFSQSVVLTSSANPSAYGHSVTLTATVTPSSATGKVTFYDGTTILGTSALAAGQATLSTILLPSGAQSLKSYYEGDGSDAAGISNVLKQTVSPVAANDFAAALTASTAVYTFEIAIGDFNGDGKADLVVLNNSLNIPEFQIFLRNGDGTFRSAGAYVVQSPYAIATGDFNEDGKTDLVLTPSDFGAFFVFLGNGDGSFQMPISQYVPGEPYGVSVADFNGDGIANLVFVVDNQVGNAVASVSLGNGDGTFQPSVNDDFTLGTEIARVAVVGDFNGDGNTVLL